MLVKVLDENRVKILMEDQDIDYYDLPFERINEGEPHVQSFLYGLLEKTRDETGLDLNNCSLMVEVIPGVSRSYYILITRISGEEKDKISFDKMERMDLEMYLFFIQDGKEVLDFLNHLKSFPPEKCELYYYRKGYYVALMYRPYQTARPGFASFIMQSEEFGGRCRYSAMNIGILREWGERIGGSELLKI